MGEKQGNCSDYYYSFSPDDIGRKLLCDLEDGHNGPHCEVLKFENPPGPDLTIYWSFDEINQGEKTNG